MQTPSDRFKYKPRKGDAVLFYSLDPDLKINPRRCVRGQGHCHMCCLAAAASVADA